ncbi:disulfide bond formation protein B [Stakelama sp. CBK3Z-3]|uniref:Disulfide bond formation protein B n=1 Tax=Stakelama flava TaxID=2860338 RepID=A0ABS6XQ66_9SPHN|nr:disulfide bond formation protein B [Stakelama flava]MBW4331918.1 disulfide bond formation protein B [Stakelama flava]
MRASVNRFRAAQILALLLPLALMAGALGSQYIGGLYPCEMCHWQRWPHYAAIIFAALSFLFAPRRPTAGVLVLIAALCIAASGAIGVFHAGVEYGWWDGITACTATFDASGDFLRVIHAPVVRCDTPQWTLFGISLAGFNAIFSLGGAAVILILLGRRRRA